MDQSVAVRFAGERSRQSVDMEEGRAFDLAQNIRVQITPTY
jgi:hypothetical protein